MMRLSEFILMGGMGGRVVSVAKLCLMMEEWQMGNKADGIQCGRC